MATLHLYKTFNGYLGKINLEDINVQSDIKINVEQPPFIIILDRSGSMGHHVKNIVNNILPEILNRLGYSNTDKIRLITFDSNVEQFDLTSDELRISSVSCRGSTHMSHAVLALNKHLKSVNSDKFRILTVSDGALDDKTHTIEAASQLALTVKHLQINSQAVRYMTGGQPDTKGLASILQLNTTTTSFLKDIPANANINCIVNEIVDQFINDGLSCSTKLVVSNPVILQTYPWVTTVVDNISLTKGDNTLWFTDLPENPVIGGETPVNVVVKDMLTHVNYNYLMEHSFEKFIDRLKILKVIGTVEAQEEAAEIVKYFNLLQTYLESTDEESVSVLQDSCLNSRILYVKRVVQKRQRSVFNIVAQIYNDARVSNLSSAQQADYLREVNVTKLGKALARRAEVNGLDFVGTVQREVKQIIDHKNELDEIDDSTHNVSFYSQDTTVGGIKSIINLIESGVSIDDLEPNDVLTMINIVGVPCSGIIGDYPDPMTWRVLNMYVGSYLSVADIITAQIQNPNSVLKPPGYNGTETGQNSVITNIIPIFDDNRVYKFLKMYAPTILEYSASVGMRRVITGIPMTHTYTVTAGVWKMVELLKDDRSTVNIETFCKLNDNLNLCLGGHFNHILEHLINPMNNNNSDKSFFICNNGVTNMINPLYNIIKLNETDNIKPILRAIYSFEAAQIMKKQMKDSNFINNSLNSLLKLDFEKFGTPVKPVFEPEDVNRVYHDSCTDVDVETFNNLCGKFYFADWVALLPDLLYATTVEDPVTFIKRLPEFNNEYKALQFGVQSFQEFKLLNLVQALLNPTKDKRVDDTSDQMLIQDVGLSSCTLLKEYVQTQYRIDYQKKVLLKKQEEKRLIINSLIDSMVSTADLEEFVTLLSQGRTFNDIVYKIDNKCSYGFIQLLDALLTVDKDKPVETPYHLEKLRILLLANHNEQTVWNNGNVLLTDLQPFKQVFLHNNCLDQWLLLEQEYNENKRHIYRDGKANRHGHSNDKPSYWALGYETLQLMIRTVTNEEWLAYKQIHYDCCGTNLI